MRGLMKMVWHGIEIYCRPIVKSGTFLLVIFMWG